MKYSPLNLHKREVAKQITKITDMAVELQLPSKNIFLE